MRCGQQPGGAAPSAGRGAAGSGSLAGAACDLASRRSGGLQGQCWLRHYAASQKSAAASPPLPAGCSTYRPPPPAAAVLAAAGRRLPLLLRATSQRKALAEDVVLACCEIVLKLYRLFNRFCSLHFLSVYSIIDITNYVISKRQD